MIRKRKSIKSVSEDKRREVFRQRISVDLRALRLVEETKSESHISNLLNALKFKHKFRLSKEKRWVTAYEMYLSDFYFPDQKIALEIDGGYHFTKTQKSKDLVKEGFLFLKGIRTLRLTNQQADSLTLEQAEDYLRINGILT